MLDFDIENTYPKVGGGYNISIDYSNLVKCLTNIKNSFG